MEFNLVAFFVAIGLVIVSAVVATVVSVTSAIAGVVQKNPEDEE